MGKVAQTCKKFHSIMTPRLHKRVAYRAETHDIVLLRLIGVMQPYISVQQNRKLISECRCDGQREGVPYGPNLGATPPCATYVREMIFGGFVPLGKRDYMAYRYLEEALKNMPGLQIVEIWAMTT